MPYDRLVRQPILAPLPKLGTPGHMTDQSNTVSPEGNPTTKGTGAIGGIVPGTNNSGNYGSMGGSPVVAAPPVSLNPVQLRLTEKLQGQGFTPRPRGGPIL